jgi:hypothetical protein
MAQSGWKAIFLLALLLIVAGPTQAQITTYYLHRESSTVVTTNMQLKTVTPDATALTLQTVELKSQPAGEYVIKTFETQANVPNVAGVIPAGASFLLRLYMDKTADAGAMNTLVKVSKNTATGTSICNGTGFALTTTRVYLRCVFGSYVFSKRSILCLARSESHHQPGSHARQRRAYY